MGFDGTGKAKLNLEYSIYNAGKTAMLRTLPKGTFDGLLRECEEVKHFKKMFAFYMQPDPLFAPGLLSNPLYMNPLASPVVTYPEYSGLGLDSNWASPIWDDLIPFGAENPNARNPQTQAFGGMNMMGQPR
ncbi:hypothetical protein OESDEN_18157 [Oesophagostomum dentatum]|uniref:Uncharacterized protein n=1 Tax=Oesophagostomum dentatum TaxID=61180 RepID=A0A0B1SE70_OESDE|nr:hypothetical protein OESDEN_18157 [Oesophagostomum dentatum]